MKKLRFSREFKIGFFGVAMLALLYWGVNFLKSKDLFTSTRDYYAVYDQVNGLQPSASIVIKGFKVGTVSTMSYDPEQSQNVVVAFAIKAKYPIPKDSKALIFSDGIMGGKAIEIVPGSSPELLQPGDTLYSEINKGFLETAGSEFEFIKQRANDVISLTVTLDNLNAILADNRAGLNTTVNNMASITGNINDLMVSEKGSLRNIIANLNSLSQTLKSKEGQIGHILTNVDKFTDRHRRNDRNAQPAQHHARQSQQRRRDGRQIRQRPGIVRLAGRCVRKPFGTALRHQGASETLHQYFGLRGRPQPGLNTL